MSHSEFCGFKADQNGAFPIEAYYEFCEKHRIPFPLDWRPKGQQTGLYTIEQAVLKIMELSSDQVEHTNTGSCLMVWPDVLRRFIGGKLVLIIRLFRRRLAAIQ